VRNRYAFYSHGYKFDTGNITLSGDAALPYVRERQGLPSELARVENQRNVLKAILAKGLSTAVVADPARFTTFLRNASKRIQMDKNLTNDEIRSAATSIRMKPSDITLNPSRWRKNQGQRRVRGGWPATCRTQPGTAQGHHGGVREELSLS
jgi:polyisoprenyl-teichoic acid--peptidoglycan teichoic acid transferase